MNKILVVLSVIFLSININAQELNCKVIVNAERFEGSSQIFKTLEKSLNEFVNQTNWTDKSFKKQERIECSMILTIIKENGNRYQGNIQVLSSRPVYNSIYTTPVFNFQDQNLNFSYTEFEPLRYNESSFQSDLVSIVSYYAYLILAMDADTFEKFGGEEYYDKCQTIASQIENPKDKPGWKIDSNRINRYILLKELQERSNKEYRESLYDYHINGLDIMESDKKAGKNAVYDAIMNLKKVYKNNRTSHLLRIFMDAKTEEIVKIFSDGPKVNESELIDTLNSLFSTNANRWSEIQ